MDKAQAQAAATALLQSNLTPQRLLVRGDLNRPWSHAEWRLSLLLTLLVLVSAIAAALSFRVPWGGVAIVAELSAPLGFLVGRTVVAYHRVLTIRCSGRAKKTARR